MLLFCAEEGIEVEGERLDVALVVGGGDCAGGGAIVEDEVLDCAVGVGGGEGAGVGGGEVHVFVCLFVVEMRGLQKF